MYTYLLVDIFAVAIPLLLSFERRIQYWRKWKNVFPALCIVAVVFAIWDILFVRAGVWGFTHVYLLGVTFLGLPLEELLFFLCIPFSCIFIYELVIYFKLSRLLEKKAHALTGILAFSFFIIAVVSRQRIYTLTACAGTSAALFLHYFFIRSRYVASFYMMYLISFIPFLIVNGILTNGIAGISSEPIVWYNNAETISVRIMGIPLEDAVYSMFLLLSNVTVYEFLRRRENAA